MPSLGYHIYIAKKIANKLNLNENDTELFLISNLIPDIKSGYLFESDIIIPTNISHCYSCDKTVKQKLPNIAKYKTKEYKKDDIISMGIFCHLMLDYYFNNFINENFFIEENNVFIGIKINNNTIKCNKDKATKIKQNNFKKIAKNYFEEMNSFKFNKNLFKNNNIYKYVSEEDINHLNNCFKMNYKNIKKNFPKNQIWLTEKDFQQFLINAEKFIFENLKNNS